MYHVRITVEVVNEEGNLVDFRGNSWTQEGGFPLGCTKDLSARYDHPTDANNALNRVWAFVNPIDMMELFKRP